MPLCRICGVGIYNDCKETPTTSRPTTPEVEHCECSFSFFDTRYRRRFLFLNEIFEVHKNKFQMPEICAFLEKIH
jgi:hypothetical protein